MAYLSLHDACCAASYKDVYIIGVDIYGFEWHERTETTITITNNVVMELCRHVLFTNKGEEETRTFFVIPQNVWVIEENTTCYQRIDFAIAAATLRNYSKPDIIAIDGAYLPMTYMVNAFVNYTMDYIDLRTCPHVRLDMYGNTHTQRISEWY